jgi:hypothetical protein
MSQSSTVDRVIRIETYVSALFRAGLRRSCLTNQPACGHGEVGCADYAGGEVLTDLFLARPNTKPAKHFWQYLAGFVRYPCSNTILEYLMLSIFGGTFPASIDKPREKKTT